MIKNIVFDMGGVLIVYNHEYFMDQMGIKDPYERKVLINDVMWTPFWGQMDNGDYTIDEMVEMFKERTDPKLADKVEHVVRYWYRYTKPIEGMREVIEKLKRNGYKIYLLSNAPLNFYEFWPLFNYQDYFDGLIVSAFEKCRKPEDKIYQRLFERFDLKPEECFYTDDIIKNVEASIKNGMQATLFTGDVNQYVEDLKKVGVKI